jgi:hypothetical protein
LLSTDIRIGETPMIPENKSPATYGTIPPLDDESAAARVAELLQNGPEGLNEAPFLSKEQLEKALAEARWGGCETLTPIIENDVNSTQRLLFKRTHLKEGEKYEEMKVLVNLHPGWSLKVLDARRNAISTISSEPKLD